MAGRGERKNDANQYSGVSSPLAMGEGAGGDKEQAGEEEEETVKLRSIP